MFLLMPPIRKNLFAIYTKICYDSDRGIQQTVETLCERIIPPQPDMLRKARLTDSAAGNAAGFRGGSLKMFPLSGSVGARCRQRLPTGAPLFFFERHLDAAFCRYNYSIYAAMSSENNKT